eukprot:TRINITY_DN4489_c0_g2_i1.p1 TRINITY_DN4489_c0_g2~~TRINITY_DN4489_c0_g2_i1.p1  ORF type:complete len:563 (+),score=53.23 TRINITY_DN4489_c0_g2_i1:278-1966(+)
MANTQIALNFLTSVEGNVPSLFQPWQPSGEGCISLTTDVESRITTKLEAAPCPVSASAIGALPTYLTPVKFLERTLNSTEPDSLPSSLQSSRTCSSRASSKSDSGEMSPTSVMDVQSRSCQAYHILCAAATKVQQHEGTLLNSRAQPAKPLASRGTSYTGAAANLGLTAGAAAPLDIYIPVCSPPSAAILKGNSRKAPKVGLIAPPNNKVARSTHEHSPRGNSPACAMPLLSLVEPPVVQSAPRKLRNGPIRPCAPLGCLAEMSGAVTLQVSVDLSATPAVGSNAAHLTLPPASEKAPAADLAIPTTQRPVVVASNPRAQMPPSKAVVSKVSSSALPLPASPPLSTGTKIAAGVSPLRPQEAPSVPLPQRQSHLPMPRSTPGTGVFLPQLPPRMQASRSRRSQQESYNGQRRRQPLTGGLRAPQFQQERAQPVPSSARVLPKQQEQRSREAAPVPVKVEVLNPCGSSTSSSRNFLVSSAHVSSALQEALAYGAPVDRRVPTTREIDVAVPFNADGRYATPFLRRYLPQVPPSQHQAYPIQPVQAMCSQQAGSAINLPSEWEY